LKILQSCNSKIVIYILYYGSVKLILSINLDNTDIPIAMVSSENEVYYKIIIGNFIAI
jgi:hypothetical protein